MTRKDIFEDLNMGEFVWGNAFVLDISQHDSATHAQRIVLMDTACEMENERLATDEDSYIERLNILGDHWEPIPFDEGSQLLFNAIRFDIAYSSSEHTPVAQAQVFHQALMENYTEENSFIYTNYSNSPWGNQGSYSGFPLTEDATFDIGVAMINSTKLTFAYFLSED